MFQKVLVFSLTTVNMSKIPSAISGRRSYDIDGDDPAKRAGLAGGLMGVAGVPTMAVSLFRRGNVKDVDFFCSSVSPVNRA